MRLVKCRCCGGVYNPDQRGGYYHVCPPEIDPETGEERLRPCHRDERPDPENPGKIRSEGAGVEEIKSKKEIRRILREWQRTTMW